MTEPGENLLASFLTDTDVACPGCGYNLRGLRGDRCPECHEQLELMVALTEPGFATWLATLIGLCCGAGAAGVGLLVIVALSLHFNDWPPLWLSGIPALTLLVEGGLALALIQRRSRRWFRAMQPPWRLVLAALAWLLTAIFAFVLIQYLRQL